MPSEPEVTDRTLAHEAIAAGKPTAWFEPLYAAAENGDAVIPWVRGTANTELTAWVEEHPGEGRRALVIGCALGDDAELLAGAGYATTAFDISPTAIKAVGKRFPESTVDYRVADLLNPPADWDQAFDLVVEIINIQAMPRDVRATAVRSLAGFVAPGGTILVSEVREESTDAENWVGPPWPFSQAEVESVAQDGVRLVSLDRVRDESRYWATFTR